MTVALDITGFVVFVILLFVAGSFLVRSLTVIAKFLRLSQFVTAFIILAVSTSLPELFVGIQAGLRHTAELAVGVVIGSNIANLTLVAGIWMLVVGKLNIDAPKRVMKDALWMVVLSTLPLVLMIVGDGLTRVDGGILLACFFIYGYWLIRRQSRTAPQENHVKRWSIVVWTLVFAVSLAALFWTSSLVVDYAGKLAIGFALPPIFIGLFFVSLGTSLPELVVGLSAGKKAGGQIALGNLIGSGISNSTLVLGVSVLISPVSSSAFLFLTSAIFMVVVGLLFTSFIQQKRVTSFEGVVLVLLYVLFIIIELTVKGLIPAGSLAT